MDDDETLDEVQNGESSNNRDTSPEPMFKFRNYKPQTKFLDGLYAVEKSQPAAINHLIQDKLDLISDADNEKRYRIDPKLLEPKKIDWDLKRRGEKRMEKLERETRKCIDKQLKIAKSRIR